nr:MAG TPA: hypothetical protein [Caudoviricetes sp.]
MYVIPCGSHIAHFALHLIIPITASQSSRYRYFASCKLLTISVLNTYTCL